MALALLLCASPAYAGHDEGSATERTTDGAAINAWNKRQHDKRNDRSRPSAPPRAGKPARPAQSNGYKNAEAKYNASLREYQDYVSAQSAYQRCVSGGSALTCPRPTAVNPPAGFTYAEFGGIVVPPTITPEQAAYVAYARLRIVPPKPMIGPPPEINEWKMAAVGYPMWLWAEGNLNPAPVSDTVYDLTVRLDARLVGVTFDMGDGHRMTCTDVSDAWVRGVAPAAPSPTCGYTYTRPSLPKGSYTITAHSEWAIDWSVNGRGGTIPLYQEASTRLPVGELQVLVR